MEAVTLSKHVCHTLNGPWQCKKHKHKNINYEQFIIMKISSPHMASFDAKTKKKMGNEFTVSDHVFILH